MQADLNRYIFDKRLLPDRDLWSYPNPRNWGANLNTIEETWLLNYSRAMNHEVLELTQAFNRNCSKEEQAEEAIDILHFLVSIALVAEVSADEYLLELEDNKEAYTSAMNNHAAFKAKTSLAALDNSRILMERGLNWKWWADSELVDRADVGKHIKNMFAAFTCLARALELGKKEILTVYTKKWQKNRQRQVEGYKKAK